MVHQVNSHVTGVSGVHHGEGFTFAVDCFAPQAVMLDVIGRLLKYEIDNRLEYEICYYFYS